MTCLSESVHPPHRLTDSAIRAPGSRLVPACTPLGGGGNETVLVHLLRPGPE